MKKLSHAGIWPGVITLDLMVVYLFYLLLWPFKTVEFHNLPFPVLDTKVKAGEYVRYEVEYIRWTPLPSQLTTSLINDTSYILSMTQISRPQGHGKAINRVYIPPQTHPGKYYLEVYVSWEVNALRTISKRLTTQEFEVIE